MSANVNGKVATKNTTKANSKKAEAKQVEKNLEALRVSSIKLASQALRAQKGSKLAATEAAQRAAQAKLEAIADSGAEKAELLRIPCSLLQEATKDAANRLRTRAKNWEGFRV